MCVCVDYQGINKKTTCYVRIPKASLSKGGEGLYWTNKLLLKAS